MVGQTVIADDKSYEIIKLLGKGKGGYSYLARIKRKDYYMYSLVKKLADLKPYDPITGEYKIRLDANESFIAPSADLLSKAAENINLNINRYPDPYAVKAVNAFSGFYGVNPDIVTAGNGSDELISLITSCFLKKGDKILCLSPDFSMYFFYPMIYELDMIVLEKETDLSINIDKVITAAKKNNVKCIIFSNPCNPTSLGISAVEVKRLIISTDALIVIDEAYMEFWNQSILTETEKYDNLIILKTCSKALSLAGVRLGFAVSNQTLTTALRAAKSPYNVNSVTQEIGALVLSDKVRIKNNISAIKTSISGLYTELNELRFSFFKIIYKPCTNFLFIEADNAENIYNYLLEQSIAVRLMGNNLRITCGTSGENEELIKALKQYEVKENKNYAKNSRIKA